MKYKVIAKSVSYFYTYVDAKDEDEAWLLAKDTDGGGFIPVDQGIVQTGDWEIYSVEGANDDQ